MYSLCECTALRDDMMSRAGVVRGVVLGIFLGLALLTAGACSADAQQGLASFPRDSLVLHTADGTERALDVELAVSREQQAQGLMYRQSLRRMPACCSSTARRARSPCG